MYCFLPFESYPVACSLDLENLSILTFFQFGGILKDLILSRSSLLAPL